MQSMLQPGMTFGAYRLVSPISRGGMGEVWRAMKAGEGGWSREVALKVMLSSLADDDRFVAQFHREASVSGMLSHPNIVSVSGFGREGSMLWIEQEFVHGEDLSRLLLRSLGGFPLPMALFVAGEILKGLEHALTKPGPDLRPLGIIHRDLKPSNVLCAYEGHVKLADFGLAKMLAEGARTIIGFRGTLGYVAPEQAHGAAASPATDVFATGLVLWQLLTGQQLFVASNPADQLMLLDRCELPPLSRFVPPDAPAGLEVLLHRFLARLPQDRFQDAGDALAALLALPVLRPATSFDLKRFIAQLPPASNAVPQPVSPADSAAISPFRALRPTPFTPAPGPPPAASPVPAPPPAAGRPPSAVSGTIGEKTLFGVAVPQARPASNVVPPPVLAPRAGPAAPPPLVAPPPVVAPPGARGLPPPMLGGPPAPVQPGAFGASPVQEHGGQAVPGPAAQSRSAPTAILQPFGYDGIATTALPLSASAQGSQPSPPGRGVLPPLVHPGGAPVPINTPPPPFGQPPAPLLGSPPPPFVGGPGPAPLLGGPPPPFVGGPGPAPLVGGPPSPLGIPASLGGPAPHAPLVFPGASASASPTPTSRRAPVSPARSSIPLSPQSPQDFAQAAGLPPPAPRRSKRPLVLAAAAVGVVAAVAITVLALAGGDREKPRTPSVSPPLPGSVAPGDAPEAPEAPELPVDVPAEGMATLQIEVDPQDARLFVNGQRVDGTRTFVLQDVDMRWPVKVRVERDGYRPFEQDVTIKSARMKFPVKLDALLPGEEAAVPPADVEPSRPAPPRRPKAPKAPGGSLFGSDPLPFSGKDSKPTGTAKKPPVPAPDGKKPPKPKAPRQDDLLSPKF